MEIVRLADQPAHVAPDRAIARQIAAPGNSRLRSHSIAHITIPAGASVTPHVHRVTKRFITSFPAAGACTSPARKPTSGPARRS